MLKYLQQLNISRKLVLAMVLTSGLITLLASGGQLYAFYKEGLTEIDQRLDEIETVHLPELTERVWISDIQNVEQHLQSLLKYPDIRSLALYEGDQRLLQVGEHMADANYQRSYDLQYDYKGKLIDIGRLIVQVSHEELHAQLLGKVAETLLINGTKTLIVGIVVLYLFNTLVTHHLVRVADHLRQLGVQEVDAAPLRLERAVPENSDDELDVVVRAVNEMAAKVAGSLAEVESKNRELGLYRARAERLIDLMESSFPNERELIEQGIRVAVSLSDGQSGELVFEASNDKGRRHFQYQINGTEKKSAVLENLSRCLDCLSEHDVVIDSTFDKSCPYPVWQESSDKPHTVCVPIKEAGRVIGFMRVARMENPYTEQDASQLNLFVHGLWSLIQRKRSDAELEASRQNFAVLMETSSAVPWIVNLQTGRYEYVADNVEEIFGYPASAWAEKDFHEKHIHQADLGKVLSKYRGSLATGDEFHAKYRLLDASGEERWVQDYGKVSEGEAGLGAKSLRGFLVDITEQERQDIALRRAQRMDAINTLAGGIAHDFNNLLGVILGYAQLLNAKSAGNEGLSKYSAQIEQAAQRGAKLTSKLLQVSKHDVEAATLVDLNLLLEEDADLMRKTLTPRVNIGYDLDPSLWPIHIDKGSIQDAILNMSINAMHAMPDGGSLRITTNNLAMSASMAKRFQLPAGDYVRLSIADTGIGMDTATQEKIFDPFFTTKGSEGTGLGLSQVYSLVRKAKGNIEVISEPGYGTEIALYLPRHLGITAAPEVTAMPVAHGKSGGEHILVVDDEPALCDIAAEFLTLSGYRVDVAENGETALVKLQEGDYDLVLSDVIMPGMSGYQLARKIRERYPDVRIQLVSGYNQVYGRDEGDDELYLNILQKPYVKDDLLGRVRSVLEG